MFALAVPTSDVGQCLQVSALLPALLTEGSVIPPVDQYLSTICSSEPCSNATLNSTASAVYQGCSTELEKYGISNQTLFDIINYYPLAREVACLKTTEAESFANASIPVNSTAYNTTNGTFCVTDLATDLSAYLGVNLTTSYIETVALGGNSSALQSLKSIPPTALCTDCIFAAVELINDEVPQLANWTIPSTNYTVDSYLNSTCSGTPYNVTNDGELPDSIFAGASNSTLNSTLISASSSLPMSTMASDTSSGVVAPATSSAASATASVADATASVVSVAASATQALAGRMAEKKRWFGTA